ncbi:hypothetical protein FHS12_001709 [Nocardioides albus]|uniref:Uncharacterized protein n=1 Tax=Nocardioides albus TaxID=1841 RepID=A0A7W5A2Z6_9ACTN|nr:hypothetical protein [Nocardioides albus]
MGRAWHQGPVDGVSVVEQRHFAELEALYARTMAR